jgi:type I restriction enzyme S subunit
MQLLEHFKDLTAHPKNAKELKGLILQLAVQGKLTKKWREQNPDVTDASILIEEIKEYNEAQLKLSNRRVKKPTVDEEVDLVLPDNWVQVHNFDLFNLQKGKNPKDLSDSKKKYPYQDIEALDRGNIRRYSDDEKAPRCKSSDIVIVCDGSRSGLVLDAEDGILGSTLAIIHTPPFIKDYIKIIFLQDFERANSNMIGAAIPHLDTKGLLQTAIGLPPLEEQKAIVEIVNQLFIEVDALEEQTKARVQLKEDFVSSALQQLTTGDTIEQWSFLSDHFKTFFTEKTGVKKLRESILQLAVQGKLTSSWRASNPELVSEPNHAQALLEKIKAEKAQLIKDKKIKKEKPLPEITEDEIPYELPEGWVWCRFQDVILDIEAGKSPKCYPEIAEKEQWGVIKMSAISWGTFDEKENKALPLEIEPYPDKEIIEGDFILTRANTSELIAKSVIVHKGVRSKLLLNDKTLRFSFSDYLSKEYLNLYNNGTQAREHYKKVSTGTSDSMQNISRDNIKGLIVPLPPLEEQKASVEKVNTLMGLCDALEKEIENSTTQVEQLMQSCLREVFERE